MFSTKSHLQVIPLKVIPGDDFQSKTLGFLKFFSIFKILPLYMYTCSQHPANRISTT